MKKYFFKNWLIILILLSGLLVRVIGIKPGFTLDHPDEAAATYGTALEMIAHGDINPRRYDYPATVPLIHNFIYRVFFIPLALIKAYVNNPHLILISFKNNRYFFRDFQKQIFGINNIDAYYWSRYISALFGVGAVWMTYLLGKKIFNKRAAILAAFFVAFNYRHGLSSHLALLDVHNSFFVLLSIYINILLLEKDTRRRYLLAGFFAGLCFSVKYQFFHFASFAIIHLYWVIKKKKMRLLWRREVFEALIIGISVFVLTNSHIFLNLPEAIRVIIWAGKRYSMGKERWMFYPLFYLYHWGIGRAVFISILIGIIISFFTNSLASLLILSYVIPYFYMMIYFSGGGGWVRNFTVVIPLLLLFAGNFLDKTLKISEKRIPFKKSFNMLSILLIILINYSPIVNSATLSYYYSRPWNNNALERWFLKYLPKEIQMRAYRITMSGKIDKLFKLNKIKHLDWSYSQGPHSLAEFQKEGTDFAVLGKGVQATTYWWYVWSDYWRFLKLKDIPFDFIESSFIGLSYRELRDYTVAEFFKPWQAYEESYLVYKIPPLPQNIGKKVASIKFDDSLSVWQVRGTFDFPPPEMFWTGKEGKTKKGCLVIDKGFGATTARLGSEAFVIKPGKLYTVRGWIKNKPHEKKNEDIMDGFLRFDVYNDNQQNNLDRLGDRVAISSRAPINNQWELVQASFVSSPENKFLTVSFQIKGSYRVYQTLLDDVEIFESDLIPEEKYPEVPYIKSIMPLSSLYHNQFL